MSQLTGILVQSPLPSGMGDDAEQEIFDAIDPMKDVDGLHPSNVGRLELDGGMVRPEQGRSGRISITA